jgi:carbonic anhydrase
MSYHSSSSTILHHCCSIDIEKPISIKGQNTGSQYDSQKHIYKVQNKIILRAHGRKYCLEEYHFHVPCQPILNCPFEIDFVFHEIGNYQDSGEENILVIGKVTSSLKSHKREPVDLTSLTTGNCYVQPVRWLVGNDPLRIDIEQVLPV